MYNYITVGPYTGPYRDIARRVKSLDPEALQAAAIALRNILPPNAVLVPVPSHSGEPTFSFVLCRFIAAASRFPMFDCLRGVPRESLCDLKNREFLQGMQKGSLMPKPETLGFRLTRTPPVGKRPCLIDNVLASGTTAAAALSLFGPDALMAVIACDETYPKVPGLVDACEEVSQERNRLRP